MPASATLNPREVAELSGAPKRLVEKAIEERVLAVRGGAARGTARRTSRALPAHAVAYAAILAKLDLRLTGAQKKRLASRLARMQPGEVATARVELTPAVELDVGRSAMPWTVPSDIGLRATAGSSSMTGSWAVRR